MTSRVRVMSRERARSDRVTDESRAVGARVSRDVTRSCDVMS